MTAYNNMIKECREVVRKYKGAVQIAKECAEAIMENYYSYYIGDTETLRIEEIKLEFAQVAEKRHDMSLGEFNSLVNAVRFLDKEHKKY